MPYTTIQRTTILRKIIDKIIKKFFYCREGVLTERRMAIPPADKSAGLLAK